MNHTILTGASSGIGLATAKALLKNGSHVLAVSRHKNEELMEFAEGQTGVIDYFEFDLGNVGQIDKLSTKIFNTIDLKKANSIHLINNAGVLEPVKLMQDIEPAEYQQNLSVNLVAPLALTSEFLKHTQNLNIDKRIINISSGAGDHPYAGWAAYCTSKAGIDMLTRVVKSEQNNAKYPTQVLSFAPGVVATNMQKHIRTKNTQQFPRVEKFIQLQQKDQLLDPEVVGKKIVELLFRKQFPDRKKLDIRDQ